MRTYRALWRLFLSLIPFMDLCRSESGVKKEPGMRFNFSQNIPAAPNTEFLRRYAKRLLRAVHSDQPSKALPIVRVHALGILPQRRMAELYHARAHSGLNIFFPRLL